MCRFVPTTSHDNSLVDAFETFGGHVATSLRTAWVLHDVNANSEGCVPDSTFGSQGRLGYYIIAGTQGFCRCIGCVHHTAHWNA